MDNCLEHQQSPLCLYMQYLQTVGVTDGSLEAAWDFGRMDWREDVLEITEELAPSMLRWLGLNIAYYHWREGVGPRKERVASFDLVWGGIFSNQIGTLEFVDLCRRLGKTFCHSLIRRFRDQHNHLCFGIVSEALQRGKHAASSDALMQISTAHADRLRDPDPMSSQEAGHFLQTGT